MSYTVIVIQLYRLIWFQNAVPVNCTVPMAAVWLLTTGVTGRTTVGTGVMKNAQVSQVVAVVIVVVVVVVVIVVVVVVVVVVLSSSSSCS